MTKDEALQVYEAQKSLLNEYGVFYKSESAADELISLIERDNRMFSHLELGYYLKKAFDFVRSNLDRDKFKDCDPMELGITLCDTLVARFKVLNPDKELPLSSTLESHQSIMLSAFVKEYGGMTLPKEEQLFEEDIYSTRKKLSVKEIYADKIFYLRLEAFKNKSADNNDVRIFLLEYRALKRIISEESRIWKFFHPSESKRRSELLNVIKCLLISYISEDDLITLNVNRSTDPIRIKEKGAALLSEQIKRLYGKGKNN